MEGRSRTQRGTLDVLPRPGGGLGESGPPGSSIASTKARLAVVTTLHQLIDTLTGLATAEPITPAQSTLGNLPLLLDAIEAGKLLSVSRAKVLDLAARGEIPSLRVGRSVRIPRDPLTAWIAENTNTVESPPPVRLPAWVHVDRSRER